MDSHAQPSTTLGSREINSLCPLLADSGHSSLRLLRHLEGAVDFDPQVADGALQLAMAKRSCTALRFLVRR